MPRLDRHPDVSWPPIFGGAYSRGQPLQTGPEGVLVGVERVLATTRDPERLVVVAEYQGHKFVGLIDCPKPDLLAELNRCLSRHIGTPLQGLGALEIPHRGFDEVKRSGLWVLPYWARDPQRARRCAAVREIFMRIPPKDWEELKKLAGSFHWFIPRATVLGGFQQCPVIRDHPAVRPDHVSFLYLSPMLESQPADFDFVLAVVVHEIAHLALGHRNPTENAEDLKLETQAWKLVAQWGFEKEARLHPKWPGTALTDNSSAKSAESET